MPAIPKGVLKGDSQRIANSLKEASKSIRNNIMLYSFAFVLIVELLSATVLGDTISKGCNPFWYVLLTQLVLFVIFLNLNVNRFLLKFCLRQILIVRSLLTYYALGSICLIFDLSENTYLKFISYLLWSIAFISLLLTVYKNKK
jgi:hypothetical protein